MSDVLSDVFRSRRRSRRNANERFVRPREGDYAVLTLHRAEAADDPETVGRVLEAAASCGMPVVFPKHPRTQVSAVPAGIEICEPMPYASFMELVGFARVVLTDSGGLQKEAYMLGVPCITLRNATEWGETVDAGWNVLAGTDPERIRAALANPPGWEVRAELYGYGNAAGRIATLLSSAGR
jgi:UDP-N-acetylglucosamine 2-epimerase